MTSAPPFRRAKHYVGQPHIISAIKDVYSTIQANPTCRALYIEARGGHGKTFLLQEVPAILGDDVRAAQIIDLSDADTRGGSPIERRLIAGLRAEAGEATYRFSPAEVDAAFEEYLSTRRTYDAERKLLTAAEREQRGHTLRQLFVDGYNRLAAQHAIVLSFDTTEALVSEPPSYDFLGDDFPTPAGQVAEWVAQVLPQLQHTLALFCGRPIFPPGQPILYDTSERAGLLAREKLTMEALSESDIEAYLLAYERPDLVPQADTFYARTHGRPLLLTCMIQSRTNPQYIESDAEPIETPAAFERFVLGTLLNPLMIDRRRSFPQQVLAYCLYVLSFARRGLSRDDLAEFLRLHSLPDAHDSLSPAQREQIDAVLDNLPEVALVKARPKTNLLYLHDEVYQMIDLNGLPAALGLEKEVLAFLIDRAEAQLRAASDPAARFVARNNRLYYKLISDVPEGYRQYSFDTYELFNRREGDHALALRDELWRWLGYTIYDVDAEGLIQERKPNLDRVTETRLTMDDIRRDDAVWLVKYYLGINKYSEAVRIGGLVRQYFEQEIEDDDYFLTDLNLTLGKALTLLGSKTVDEALARFAEAGKILSKGEQINQKFLRDHVDFFRGEAATLSGYAKRRRSDFDGASADYAVALQVYRQYLERYPDPHSGRFDVIEALVQAIINQIYVDTRQGRLMRARILARNLRGPEYYPHLSPDRQINVLISNAIAFSGSSAGADLDIALQRISEAEDLVSGLRNRRLSAQVAMRYAIVLSEKVRVSNEPDLSAEHYFTTAEQIFEETGDSISLHAVLLEHGTFYLRLGRIHESNQQAHLAAQNFEKANNSFDRALSMASEPDPLARADLLSSKAIVYRLLGDLDRTEALLAEADSVLQQAPALAYAQLVAGEVAYTRGRIALTREQWPEAIGYIATALARYYVYSREQSLASIFHKRIENLFSRMETPEIKAIRECLSDPQQIPEKRAEELQYQPPDPSQWGPEWHRAIDFITDASEAVALSRGII
ncbi:MAG: hypothetical protein IPO81_02310 [Kouleothrix sp.]|nr:hypothetical protein [Kouleothrix sp.]